jgi:hypothetical protein
MPTIGLDAHDHLFGLLSMIADRLVEPHHSLHPLGDPNLGELRPLLIHHAGVVVVLGPFNPDEDHAAPSFLPAIRNSFDPGGVHGVLMDQCSIGTTSHKPSPPRLLAGARSRSRTRWSWPLWCSPAGGSESSLCHPLLESH